MWSNIYKLPNNKIMSNEEIIEEFYSQAHKFGVFNEFVNEVSKLMKTAKLAMYDAVTMVYYQFINKGLIIEVCPI